MLVRPTPLSFYPEYREPTSWITTPGTVEMMTDFELDGSTSAKLTKLRVYSDFMRPFIFGFNILRKIQPDENIYRLVMQANIRWTAEKVLGIERPKRNIVRFDADGNELFVDSDLEPTMQRSFA